MIRRPLFTAAISFLSAVFIYFIAGKIIACISFAALFVICMTTKGAAGKVSMIALVFYTISMFNCIIYDSFECSLDKYADTGKEIYVLGEVTDCLQKTSSSGEKYLQIILMSDLSENEKHPGKDKKTSSIFKNSMFLKRIMAGKNKLLVNVYDEKADSSEYIPGYILKIKGEIKKAKERRNPGCFDYRLYLRSIGVSNVMTAENIQTEDKKDTLTGRIYIFKESYLDKMKESIGKEMTGFVKGVMFGDKDGISDDVMDEFQRNAHILAVSGLHIGMIYGVISRLWIWRKRKLYFVVVSVFLCCYCIMASFSPSVVRAVFMVETHLVSKLINRRYDLSCSAFLIAILMVWNNPMQLFNSGFQMSFIAVLTLAAIMPFVKSVYEGIFAASLSVQIGLLPYTMYVFNYISIAAVFINVPVIFLTGILVPLCLLAFPASLLCDPFFVAISKPICGICEIVIKINSIACAEGITSFDVTSPSRMFLGMFYIGILVFMSQEGRLIVLRHGKKAVIIMLLICMAFSIMFVQITRNGFEDARIIFVDVGQGDCIHLKSAEGGNYLIDGGGKKDYNVGKETLKPYLLKNGVKKIDGAFVTHLHEDHYKGIAELCREGMVKKLFVYAGNILNEKKIIKDTGLSKENIIYLKKGDFLKMSSDINIQVLWPEYEKCYESAAYDDENEVSLILKASVGDLEIIATGDIDSVCHDKLAKDYGKGLSSEILKVAHHGSRYSYSEKFTEFTSPRYAVFQVGEENIYGHPDSKIIENYEKKGIMVYRNDKNGAVGFIPIQRETVVTMIR